MGHCVIGHESPRYNTHPSLRSRIRIIILPTADISRARQRSHIDLQPPAAHTTVARANSRELVAPPAMPRVPTVRLRVVESEVDLLWQRIRIARVQPSRLREEVAEATHRVAAAGETAVVQLERTERAALVTRVRAAEALALRHTQRDLGIDSPLRGRAADIVRDRSVRFRRTDAPGAIRWRRWIEHAGRHTESIALRVVRHEIAVRERNERIRSAEEREVATRRTGEQHIAPRRRVRQSPAHQLRRASSGERETQL